ncbi:MAG TPA: hypothetical protein VFE62_01945, partial [Gemmataceae bacterium]|nr:hypothetical protein [Gemmataceae bacterium]
MSRLDQEPEVIELARKLGLSRLGDPVLAVVGHCLNRIGCWVRSDGPVSTIGELESVVARRLHMVFEEVETDEALDALIRKYVKLGEGVFAYLKHDLEGETFGATYRRSTAAHDAPDRLVAIIDCRGDKQTRRFFTRWHEVAHFLIEPDPEAVETPVRRASYSPLERLMDEIAAHTGFYEPIFGPAFAREMAGCSRLTFQVVEAVRRQQFAEASFQATLFACHRRLTTPVLYLEAALAHKADEARQIKQGVQWLFDEAKPEALVRAVQVIANDAAKESGLLIHENMRVPPSSVIHGLFQDEAHREGSGR